MTLCEFLVLLINFIIEINVPISRKCSDNYIFVFIKVMLNLYIIIILIKRLDTVCTPFSIFKLYKTSKVFKRPYTNQKQVPWIVDTKIKSILVYVFSRNFLKKRKYLPKVGDYVRKIIEFKIAVPITVINWSMLHTKITQFLKCNYSNQLGSNFIM